MKQPDVTEAEFDVLQRLWETPHATIRQLTEHLYPKGGTAHYSTVQKLLERLEAKGCVMRHTRETTHGPHQFSAAIGREELMAVRVRAVADKFGEGSLTPLLTHLVKARKLSSRDIEELRALIDDLDRKKGRGASSASK